MSSQSRRLLVSCACAVLAGCDWVDSAGGSSGDEGPQNEAPVPQIVQDDDPIDGPLVYEERVSETLTAAGLDADGTVQAWRWNDEPTSSGALAACEGVEGFDSALAATLENACAAPGCGLSFDELPAAAEASGRVEFVVDVPILQAPVGVSYALTAIDNQGAEGVMEYTFCLLSVNEPPQAMDDTFSMLEGTQLVVDATTLNLLSNDTDDIDAANQPLRVVPQPAQAPASASVFDLGEDGGFIYAYAGTSLGDTIEDVFEYTLTDGTFEDTAAVTIRIVARNDPPELIGQIPVLIATAGIAYEADLATYFDDPEGADLMFSVVGDDPLPAGFALSDSGILSGTADAGTEGDTLFRVEASDGDFAVSEELTLSVLDNRPVVVDPIEMQAAQVGVLVRFRAGRFFSDPEEQPITYALSTNDAAVNLAIAARTGVVTGFISEAGQYRVLITADDGVAPPTEATVVFNVDP